MRLNPVYAPDGMTSTGRSTERFDDGLVHNHHWAVTGDEAYPSDSQGPAFGRTSAETSPFQSHRRSTHPQDQHDDGLVHNHHWAMRGQ